MQHQTHTSLNRIATTAILSACIVGCGGSGKTNEIPTYPASGTITYNGEPLADAMIILRPIGQQMSRPPFASSDASGAFTLSTFGMKDGAPEGNYQVSVTKFSDESGEEEASDDDVDNYQPPGFDGVEEDEGPESLIPERYNDAATSELTAKISAEGENTITLELVD